MSRGRSRRKSKRNAGSRVKGTAAKNPARLESESDDLEAMTLTFEQHSAFAGPLPPPEFLERYDQIIPGLGQQITEEARANGDHRRKQEDRVVRANTFAFRVGALTAPVVDILVVAGGIYLIATDKQWIGLVLLLAELAWFKFGRKK